jgi:sugar-phosphatase
VALTTAVLATLAEMVAEGERPAEVPGAGRVLAAAARAGLPTAVVTSARREWTARVLEALGAPADLRLVTAEDCARGKPDPEPYRRGAEALKGGSHGLPAAGLVAFEDAPAGVASASGAGVGLVVGVTTSLTAEELLAAGAHGCVPDLQMLAGVLEDLRPQPPARD